MKKLIPLLILVFSLAISHQTIGQVKTISGSVKAESDGTPLPGVNVVVQGTTRGSQTDFDGNYLIEASTGDVLIFSFIGMKTQTITVASSTTINIILKDDAQSLDEVMITALGMKKEKKALTYAAQEVKGDDLTKVKQTNKPH